jgi:riboflavin kinase / FMN adenylyltransferase
LRIVWVTSRADTALKPIAAALGNFDGIHLGHQQVIAPILPSQLSAVQDSNSDRQSPGPKSPGPQSPGPKSPGPKSPGPQSTVITFYPHPKDFFTGQRRTLLTPLDEKVQVLRQLGLQQLVLLPFDRALAALPPEQFIEEILIQQLQVECISVGTDFHFGKDRKGNTEQLRAIAQRHGITVHTIDLELSQGDRISSSRIRAALNQGDMATANALLGRPYVLSGKVVAGQQLARQLGFPTANLSIPPEKFLPAKGVYAVQVQVGYDERLYPGVMNLGDRPTVQGQAPLRPTAEVHLFNWQEDLYGQTLRVSLRQTLRPEQKFESLTALQAQIRQDCDQAQQALQG